MAITTLKGVLDVIDGEDGAPAQYLLNGVPIDGSAAWGLITGNINDQTDLPFTVSGSGNLDANFEGDIHLAGEVFAQGQSILFDNNVSLGASGTLPLFTVVDTGVQAYFPFSRVVGGISQPTVFFDRYDYFTKEDPQGQPQPDDSETFPSTMFVEELTGETKYFFAVTNAAFNQDVTDTWYLRSLTGFVNAYLKVYRDVETDPNAGNRYWQTNTDKQIINKEGLITDPGGAGIDITAPLGNSFVERPGEVFTFMLVADNNFTAQGATFVTPPPISTQIPYTLGDGSNWRETPVATTLTSAFADNAERDAYFELDENFERLTTDFPIMVRNGVSASIWYWSGMEIPPTSYDPDDWVISAVNSGPSLFLGIDGMVLSSGARVLNMRDAFGDNVIPVHLEYDSSGSGVVRTFDFPASFIAPVNTIKDTTLADPQELTFPATTSDTLTQGFVVNAATVGTLRIRTWAGSDDSGSEFVDNMFEIEVGDVGIDKLIPLQNHIMTYLGDMTFSRFSGVQLNGGVQVSGPFVGETAPFLSSDVFLVTKKTISPPLFGSDYQYEADETESSTSSTTFQNKVTLVTPVIPAGRYRAETTFEVTNDSGDKPVVTESVLDGVQFGESSYAPKFEDAFITKTSFAVAALTNISHTIELNYRSTDEGGTAKIKRARVELFRID